jgi:hypothetical protein
MEEKTFKAGETVIKQVPNIILFFYNIQLT